MGERLLSDIARFSLIQVWRCDLLQKPKAQHWWMRKRKCTYFNIHFNLARFPVRTQVLSQIWAAFTCSIPASTSVQFGVSTASTPTASRGLFAVILSTRPHHHQHHHSTVPLPHHRFTTASPPLHHRPASTLPPLYHHFDIALLPLQHHFVNTSP